MATITATKTGNWSDTTVWDLARAPLDGDTVLAVTYTITFDVDVNQANTTLNATSGNFRYSSAGTRNVTANANVGNHSTTGLIQNTSTGTLNFTGAITGGNGSYAYGANNASSGTITITTCTGGNGFSAYGANNASSGTITITTCTGGSGGSAYGANNASSGTITITTAIGNDYGPGGTHSNSCPGVFANNTVGQVTRVYAIQFGAHGQCPIAGPAQMVSDASNQAVFVTNYSGSTRTLTPSGASADFPAESDVRYGVDFDNGDQTGTCYVPSASNVALGISVDATTGTAVLTAAAAAAAIWDVARSSHDTDGTFGDVAEWAGVGGGLTAQEVRDAMKLAPTAGSPAAGSIDAYVDAILADTGTDGVVLASTQGMITWDQQAISANIDGDAALIITNANVTGYGIRTSGNLYGIYNTGGISAGAITGSLSGSVGSVTGAVGSVGSGVTLAPTQGMITWDQQTISANINGDAALVVTNSNITGLGARIQGNLGDVSGDITGNLSGSVGSVTAGVTISGTLTTLDAIWAKIQKWLRLALRKDSAVATDHATELTEINANGGSGAGSYANITDSQEAISDRIGTATVTVVSPVSANGTAITVIRGDDYLLTDGRQLAWTSASWPTLTGGTVKLRIKFGKNATVTEYSATLTGAQACYVALTTTQTAAMVPGVYNFDLQATLSNLSTVTLVQGVLNVREDVR